MEIPEIELSEALYVGLVFEPLIWPGECGLIYSLGAEIFKETWCDNMPILKT